MRIAVLATANQRRVYRAIARSRRRYGDCDLVVCVPETEAWRYEERNCEVWRCGEDRLPLGELPVLENFRRQQFDRIVIPVEFPPLQAMLFVERFVRRPGDQVFVLDCSPFFRTSRRMWIRLFLLVYSYLVYAPIGLLLRAARLLDGALVLAFQLAAGFFGRSRKDPSNSLVCHVVTSLATGGAQRQLLAYLESAPDSVADLRVIALFSGNRMFQQAFEETGVNVEVLEEYLRTTSTGVALLSGFRHMSIAAILWRRLVKLRPTCTYSWLFTANVLTAPAARFAGVPRIVSSIRNMSQWKQWREYRRWWYRWADRLSAPLNDAIVGNSQAVVEDYRRWSGASRVPFQVIPNAVDGSKVLGLEHKDVREALAIDRESVVVLTVGRLAHEKNHAMLLRCCRRLLDQGHRFRLLVVGHGIGESDLHELARDLELGESVIFAGKTSRTQDFYRAADIFALSSSIEGMPNVLLEAQLFGLPVVTTNAGGSAEVVEDGVSGFVVPLDDEVGFAGRLRELICDPDLRESMGEKARERILSQFTVECLRARIDRLSHRIEPVE